MFGQIRAILYLCDDFKTNNYGEEMDFDRANARSIKK